MRTRRATMQLKPINYLVQTLWRRRIIILGSSALIFLFGLPRHLRLRRDMKQHQNISSLSVIDGFPSCDPPQIEYRLDYSDTSRSEDEVLRFVAYYKVIYDGQCADSSNSMQPLTIENWKNCMMGDHSNRLAMELTNIIKVRSSSRSSVWFSILLNWSYFTSLVHFEHFALKQKERMPRMPKRFNSSLPLSMMRVSTILLPTRMHIPLQTALQHVQRIHTHATLPTLGVTLPWFRQRM